MQRPLRPDRARVATLAARRFEIFRPSDRPSKSRRRPRRAGFLPWSCIGLRRPQFECRSRCPSAALCAPRQDALSCSQPRRLRRLNYRSIPALLAPHFSRRLSCVQQRGIRRTNPRIQASLFRARGSVAALKTIAGPMVAEGPLLRSMQAVEALGTARVLKA